MVPTVWLWAKPNMNNAATATKALRHLKLVRIGGLSWVMCRVLMVRILYFRAFIWACGPGNEIRLIRGILVA